MKTRKEIIELAKKYNRESVHSFFIKKGIERDYLLNILLEGSKTERSGYFAHHIAVPLIKKYPKNKKVIRTILEAIFNGSETIQHGSWSYVANYFIKYCDNEQILDKILQAILNGSNSSQSEWANYVVYPLLKKYPDNKKLLSVVFQALQNGRKYDWVGNWGFYVAIPFIDNPNVNNEQKEIIRKLYKSTLDRV